jgi:mannose-6-phosphate isomerase-like protein (cupin superfamily)
MSVISKDGLPISDGSHELEGREHGVGASLIFVDAPPGAGPALHKHAYEEIFVILEGEAKFTLGDEERTVHGGEIVIAPPETPHAFVNSGTGRLRQIDIHVSPRFVTDWLDR